MWEAKSKVTFLLATTICSKRPGLVWSEEQMYCFPQMDVWVGHSVMTRLRAMDFVSSLVRSRYRSVIDLRSPRLSKKSLCMCVFGVCVCLPHHGSTSITLQATGEALREISLCGSCPLLCLIKSGRDPICVSLFKGCGSEASPFIYWVAAQDWWSVPSEVTACPFSSSRGSLRTTGVPQYCVSTSTLCPCSHLLHRSESVKGSGVERTFHLWWTLV